MSTNRVSASDRSDPSGAADVSAWRSDTETPVDTVAGAGGDDDRPVPEAVAPGSDHPAHEDALLSRLAVIADQPLSERADALAQLHDELRTRLESGDAPRPSA